MSTVANFPCTYLDRALYHLPQVIEEAREVLPDDFDTLVGTGFFGALVVPELARLLGKHFAIVRKETDDSHHGGGRIVGRIGARWIFVDDLISSGRTRERVIERVGDHLALRGVDSTFVGTCLYQFEPVTFTRA